MIKSSSPMVALYVSLVFASGAVVGVVGDRLYSARVVIAKQAPKHEDVRQRYLREYETRLKLSAEQMAKLVVILDESKARFKEARDRQEPEMKQIMADQRAKIREMLMGDQKPEYEKMLEERERRRKGPPPPGGHK